MAVASNHERSAMLSVWGLAALACILGLAHPPPDSHFGHAEQLLDFVRIAGTVCLAITLLLGPGILWRASAGRARPALAFLPLPGLALLALTGCVAWVLAPNVDPRLTCFAVFAPLLGLLLGGLLGTGSDDLFEAEERRALLIVGCALGIAVARALWSLGPEGELYAGTISRTLEVGDRSDSRIPFVTIQLIAHGSSPYGEIATSYLFPYNFSSRGPLSGLASAPIVLMSGGRPAVALPDNPWRPFDPQGFMAYRLAMMAFASTAFLSLWQLTRRLGGHQAARVALLLAATTPFLIHEIWFTWPKLLAASFVLLGGICIVERRAFRSGLMVGVGYLMHPGALLSMSGLGLLALWPLKGANWRRPDLKAAVLIVAGTAVALVAWRLVNGSHYIQGGFSDYLTVAYPNLDPSPLEWLIYRAVSVGNTFVPMLLPISFADNMTVNVVGGTSPPSVHFFFQYWNGLPFGAGIVFFPLLLVALWHAWRLWKWPVFAAVVAPLLAFTIYWGASQTGMLREGLQAWVLVLFVVVALQQRHAGFPWLKSKPIRAILALRPAEVMLVAIGPALATGQGLISANFTLNDTVALATMLTLSAYLARLVWSATPAGLSSSCESPPTDATPTSPRGNPPGSKSSPARRRGR